MTVQLESENHRKIREIGILAHRHFQATYNHVYSALRNMNGGRVMVVVGPSRVGKSELLRQIISALRAEIRPRREDDQPILLIEADLGNDARMSLRQFEIECLKNIRHPVFANIGEDDEIPTKTRLSSSESILRLLLLTSMKHRGTMYLFVDEAHHLLMTIREKLQSDILEALKNLCNKSDVVLVLVGGYRLLDGLFQSAHFNGRMEIVHFPGYADVKEDLDDYASILASLESVLPVSEPGLFVKNARKIRELFWGAIGATIDGIRAAESRRIARGAKVLEMLDVLSARLPDKAKKALLDDIKGGCEFFARELAKPDTKVTLTKEPSSEPDDAQVVSRKGKKKPFEKNPVRRTSPNVEVK